MKRYKEYKDSGVEWIGEIPSHWQVKKWKYITNVLTDYTANGSFGDLAKNVQYLDYKDYARLVRLTDLRDGCRNEGIYVTEKAYRYLSKSKLNGGEFLIANVGAYSGLICEMPYLEEKATLGPNMMMAKFNKNIDNKFMIYVGNSSYSQMQLKDRANRSSAQPKLNKDDFRSIVIVTPTVEEQRQIVDYLDKKTSHIDNLISKKEELIETLKASRNKLISETVTKGLDKSVPMKDSGVEWIGEIPSHWDISKLKFNSKYDFMYGANESGEDIQKNHPRYIRITDIDEMGNLKDETYTTLDYKKAKPYILEDGDILFARSGATVGKTFLYEQEKYGMACFAGYLIKFNPDNKKCNSKYMYYYTQSKMYEDFININISQATIQNVSAEKYKNLYNPLPPLKEQEEIVIYLDNKTLKIDKLINSIKEQIELLKKAKQKLITEVVTGKIDVTNI